MINKVCWGLNISIPQKSVKELWLDRTPIIEELVAPYYWRDKGSKESQKKYNDVIKKLGIKFSGELDVESYKKESIYQVGQLEQFWIEYPEHKRTSPQYKKDLKKLIFTCKHPQILSYKNDWYLGIRKRIKEIRINNKKNVKEN